MSYRDVFGEILADHHESPRNWGVLEHPTRVEQGYNPLCGDKISLSMEAKTSGSSSPVSKTSADAEMLCHVAFEGEGCSICMASASIMSSMIEGKSFSEIQKLIEGFRQIMQGAEVAEGMPKADEEQDIVALYGIKRFPVRIKCALLPWTTLKKGLEAIHAK